MAAAIPANEQGTFAQFADYLTETCSEASSSGGEEEEGDDEEEAGGNERSTRKQLCREVILAEREEGKGIRKPRTLEQLTALNLQGHKIIHEGMEVSSQHEFFLIASELSEYQKRRYSMHADTGFCTAKCLCEGCAFHMNASLQPSGRTWVVGSQHFCDQHSCQPASGD